MDIVWHRRDLRVADNETLATATAEADAVAPVFVFDDAVLEHGSPPRVAFMLDALASLREAYRERGSDLVVAAGDPADVLPELAATAEADRVCWSRDYSGLAKERDADVRLALDDADVAREAVHDELHHEPGSITTNDGDHYSVYTYFWKKWKDRPKDEPYEPPASAELGDVTALQESIDLPWAEERNPLPTLALHGGTNDLNRFGVEQDRIDVLAHPMAGDGDFNHVLAKAAAEHGVRVEFAFGRVLRASGGQRVQVLQDMRKLRELVDQYDAPYVVSADPTSHLELRGPRELVAVGEQIGFTAEAVRAGLAEWGTLAERNRDRQSEAFIEPGVRRGRYEEDG